ncbi:MAG: hypothetical protein M1596_04945 [Firmicutes bacterium]|nr:hypothetical protein [Bacillota bacterium]
MPQQTLNSENNTAVVWMTQTTETVSFPESGAILSTGSPNSENLANDPVAYWLEIIRHMSNRTIVAYHNALRMPGEKEGISMKSPHQLYNIDSESRPVVSQWFEDHPRLPRVIEEIARQAQQLWAKTGCNALPLRITAENEDDQMTLILSIPSTDNPERDTDLLWELMTWRSTEQRQDVSSLPIILMLEYPSNAEV